MNRHRRRRQKMMPVRKDYDNEWGTHLKQKLALLSHLYKQYNKQLVRKMYS
jgi:hypothetical protein